MDYCLPEDVRPFSTTYIQRCIIMALIAYSYELLHCLSDGYILNTLIN